ncbi:ATP-binding protein [Vibrio breoganii]|uniref:ATP-binding protein n=1 Tax=Vibrio breoganii TaxID=553239 RepID=UPI001F537278|nr:transporter substrate-binding domain-containing protein [Vibrio breoganii]
MGLSLSRYGAFLKSRAIPLFDTLRFLIPLLFGLLFPTLGLADIELTEEEKAWLREGQKVQVAVFESHHPFMFTNNRGEFAGIVNDYLQYIEKETDIDFIEVPIVTLEEGYQGIEDGSLDLYPMTFDFSGSQIGLNYSVPYLPYHYFVFTNINDTFEAKLTPNSEILPKLAVIKGSAVDRYLHTQESNLEAVYFQSDREALKALDAGVVDAFVGEKVSSQGLIKGLHLKNVKELRPVRALYGLRLQMATNPKATQLLSIINKTLKSMPYDIQNGIMAHWYDNEPHKNRLNGYTYFNRVPYMYTSDSAVGLEFSILQHLFESMGYEAGSLLAGSQDFDYAKKLVADDLDFVSTQIVDSWIVQNQTQGDLFYSDPYLVQEYRLVSRLGERIALNGQVPKIVGSIVSRDDVVVAHAIKMLGERFGRGIDKEFIDLTRALEALDEGEVDYLLLDSRQLSVHFSRLNQELNVNITHDQSTRFRVPLTIAFRDPVLRDKFNAEISVFARSAKYRRLEKLYENASFRSKAQSGELMVEIITYLISVDRAELIDKVFEAFNFSSGFEAISLQRGDNPNNVTNYSTNRGRMVKVDDFSRQGLIHLTKPLLQDDGIEQVILGELTIYSELTNSTSFDQNYTPPLSVFEGFSAADYQNIREIYQRSNLQISTLNLSQQEVEWIKKNPVISVGIDPAALPYEGVQNGEYRGIVADVLKDMSRKVGVQFEPYLVGSWQETVEKVERQELPMVSAAIENKSMSYDYVTTLPLFTDQLAVAGRTGLDYGHGLESMDGKRVGIQRGASNTPTLMDNYPEIEWVLVDSSAFGLQRLANEQLEGYVDTTYVINFIFNEHSYRNLSIVDRLDYTVTPTFHTLKSEPILRSIVTKAVRSISASRKQQIINNWASSRVIEKTDYRMILLISGFSLLVLVIFFISNRRLKKQVEATTKAEQEALASRNQLFDILNTSSIAAIMVQNDRIVYSNTRALEQFKLNSNESYGTLISRVYADAEDRENVYQELQDKGKIVDREMVFQREDNSQFTALCSYYEIDYLGQPAVLFWSYDISEIKALNKELANAIVAANIANQTKSDFLANMSHEIRTPMNAIIGMSYLALEGNLNSKARNYISKVHQSAQSLLLIINDILDISKIESGKLDLEQRPFSLKDTLRDIANILSFRIAEKNVDFIYNIERSIPRMVIGDELRLSQVLINLGNNATKFTDKGEILIGLEAKPVDSREDLYRYHFYVQDTGIGIAEDKLNSLFESFQQADASTTREYGGTGLGLSISRQIIELMGGRIWVESELGIGSTFHFEVELKVATNANRLNQERLDNISDLRDKSLWVLESSEKGELALRNALLGTDLNPRVYGDFSTLLEALKDANQVQSIVYVCDVGLSKDASIFQSQLRQLKEKGRVILSSANEDRTTLARENDIETLPRPWLPFEFLAQVSGLEFDDAKQSTGEDIDHEALLRGTRVLLVEDNELNQELVLGLLEPFDLDIDVVGNGQLAVEKAKLQQYAIILMDIQMPVLGGYQATEQIRAFDKQTPIVAMTANAMVGDEEKAAAVGMDDYLAKPIEVARLMEVLVRAAQKEQGLSDATPQIIQPQVATKESEEGILFSAEKGLQTCNQNRALLLNLLRKYLTNSSARIDSFAQAMEEKDWETAKREIHTVKGTSANIGAMVLTGLCVRYEQQMHSNSPELTHLQIERLRSVLMETEAAIEEYLHDSHALELLTQDGEQDDITVSAQSVRYEELYPHMSELKGLVENYDLQATDKVKALREQYSQTELLQLLDAIEGALASYQFDGALKVLNDWFESHKS